MVMDLRVVLLKQDVAMNLRADCSTNDKTHAISPWPCEMSHKCAKVMQK